MIKNQHPKCTMLTVSIFLILLCTMSNCYRILQAPSQVSTVPLNQPLKFSQQARNNKYFQTSIPSPSSSQLLLITISAQIQTSIHIYVSTSASPQFSRDTWPSYQSYTQSCYYSSIDTCAIKMPDTSSLSKQDNNTLTVYFTVRVGSDTSYTLDVSLQTVFQVKTDRKYTAEFVKAESAMVELNGSNWYMDDGTMYQQIVLYCYYASFNNIGHFQILAQQQSYPNPTSYSTIKSQSLNALSQILLLPAPKTANASYFILLQAQNDTKLNFTFDAIASLVNPILYVNQSVTYLTDKNINYSLSQPFEDQFFSNSNNGSSNVQPLVVQMFAYRGQGKFIVSYCNLNDNDLYNYTFQSLGGQSAQIQISAQTRILCYQNTKKSGGLLFENLDVDIVDVAVQFGYTIGVYQGQFQNVLIVGVKEIAVLQDMDDIDVYDAGVYGNATISLTGQVYVGSVTINITQCLHINNTISSNCTQLKTLSLSQSSTQIGVISFTCPPRSTCRIYVSQTPSLIPSPPSYAKYSIILSIPTSTTQLKTGIPEYNVVQLNQYQYYFINVTALRKNMNISNATIISIINTQINGDIVMLTSTSQRDKNMEFKDLWKQNSTVRYGWEGQTKYTINSTFPPLNQCCIYIAILGDSQSIYSLQYTVNTSANIPSAYLDLVQGTTTTYTISSQQPYLLVKYRAHILPYTLLFTPMPSCIRMGTKLPFSQQCISSTNMKTQYHQQIIYFNISQVISNQGDVFNFGITVNAGQYDLGESQDVVVGCQRQCWEKVVVTVTSKGDADVLHTGDGYIQKISTNTSNNTNTRISNKALTLTCLTPPCQFTLNASLPAGGIMELSYYSSNQMGIRATEISWRTKPFRLPGSAVTPKHFYYQLPKYLFSSSSMSLIFYSAAADLTIYYNLVVFNQSYTNVVNYSYPKVTPVKDNNGDTYANVSNYIGVSYGDPLKQIHILDVDQQILEDNMCNDRRVVCILTMTAVLNRSVQYSSQYLSSGLGYTSSNTYSYQISPSYPITNLKQSYSISYFSYKIDFASQTSPSLLPFTLYIQPLSNCRPYLQIQRDNYARDYYLYVKLPRVMPGQSRINFRVVSNDVCRYSTAITNLQYPIVFAGLQTQVKVDAKTNKTVFGYQHTMLGYRVSIQLKSAASSIVINKVSYRYSADTSQPQLILPQITPANNIAYTINSSTISFTPQQLTQYLISISYQPYTTTPTTHVSIPTSTSILISLQNTPITLLHNQQSIYIYDPNDNSIDAQVKNNGGVIKYQYNSVNNFYMFVTVSRWQVSIKVYAKDNNYYNNNPIYIIQKTISNKSQPWIYVNITNSYQQWDGNTEAGDTNLGTYIIQCQYISDSIQTSSTSNQKSTFKIHVEQDGVKGLQQLYNGVVVYDAFVLRDAMNCYIYDTGIVLGQNYVIVDVDFKSIPNINISSTLIQPLVKVLPKQSSSSSNTAKSVHANTSRISPTTTRLILPYTSQSLYKICILISSNNNNNNNNKKNLVSLVGRQYSVIVNIPAMPMVYDAMSVQNQDIGNGIYGGGGYNMFQYINDKQWSNINTISNNNDDDIQNNDNQDDDDDQYWNAGYYDRINKSVVVNVINCMGQSVLLGSSSFQDMLTGKMTDLQTSNIYSNNGIVSAVIQIPYGYYYLGIKSQNISKLQLFRLQLQPTLPTYMFPSLTPQSAPVTPYSLYTINWLQVPTVGTRLQNNIEYMVLRIPPVIKIKANNNNNNGNGKGGVKVQEIPNPTKIMYKLYVVNVITGTNQDSNNNKLYYQYDIDQYVRCPALWHINNKNNNRNTSILQPVQTIVVQSPYSSSSSSSSSSSQQQHQVQFKVPLTIIQRQSNISITAQVYLPKSATILTYYYGQDDIYVTYPNDGFSLWTPIKWLFFIALAIVAIGGAAFIIRFMIIRRNRRNVQFQEDHTVTMQQEEGRGRDSTQEQEGREMQVRNTSNNNSNNNNNSQTSSPTSNRRPLNKDVGYGEFVDQV